MFGKKKQLSWQEMPLNPQSQLIAAESALDQAKKENIHLSLSAEAEKKRLLSGLQGAKDQVRHMTQSIEWWKKKAASEARRSEPRNPLWGFMAVVLCCVTLFYSTILIHAAWTYSSDYNIRAMHAHYQLQLEQLQQLAPQPRTPKA